MHSIKEERIEFIPWIEFRFSELMTMTKRWLDASWWFMCHHLPRTKIITMHLVIIMRCVSLGLHHERCVMWDVIVLSNNGRRVKMMMMAATAMNWMGRWGMPTDDWMKEWMKCVECSSDASLEHAAFDNRPTLIQGIHSNVTARLFIMSGGEELQRLSSVPLDSRRSWGETLLLFSFRRKL